MKGLTEKENSEARKTRFAKLMAQLTTLIYYSIFLSFFRFSFRINCFFEPYYQYTLNHCPRGKHMLCFPLISMSPERSKETKQMFPEGAIIKCFAI